MKRMMGFNSGYDMKRILYSAFIITGLIFMNIGPVVAEYSPYDSIGVKSIDNEIYIIHRVEAGETLYALSRRYHVDVNNILKANQDLDESIKIGQEIKIPVLNENRNPSGDERIVHVVKSGETLYGLSRKYNVPVGNIKKWNSLTSNTISIGEKLVIRVDQAMASSIEKEKEKRENNGKIIHLVNPGETLYSISRKYNSTVDDIKEWNHLENNTLFVGQELIVGYSEDGSQNTVMANNLNVEKPNEGDVKVKKQDIEERDSIDQDNPVNDDIEEKTNKINSDNRKDNAINNSENNRVDNKKITEKGMARVIDGSESTKKYLALHRTAPIGTIMQVRNEMNDLTVFVRVIGKLPDTGENQNILLKISKTAYDRLGVSDEQFPVEITYHP